MINQTKKAMSEKANQAINAALSSRIPYYNETRMDDNPHYVCQSDIFGYVDTVIQLGSDRLYCAQNKSRNDSSYDICVECRSFRGTPHNLTTGNQAPIAGAHWCNAWQRWLSPRFSQCDVVNYYLPSVGFVGSFSRYYLEIMLSRDETWSRTTGIHKVDGSDTDTFIAFFNYADFTLMYMDTVARSCGLADLQREQNAASTEPAKQTESEEAHE